MKKFTTFFLLTTFLSSASFATHIRGDQYSWPVKRVIDGDTIEIDPSEDFPKGLRVSVRVRGIDTPEKFPRAKCDSENALADRASSFTAKFIAGKEVRFSEIAWDKYGGRVLAKVIVMRERFKGEDLAQALIKAGLARPYYGKKKQTWCK